MTKSTRSDPKAGRAVAAASRRMSPLMDSALQAAQRVCRDLADGQAARDQMKRDVLDTPPELLADLLQALSRERIHRADLLPNATPSTKESKP